MPAQRAMVRAALEQRGDFRVCAEAADAESALLEAERAHPDVCLLDINMPGSGIAAAARITASLPDTAVVMLTVSRQDEDLFDALRAGASGYLLKGMDEDRIGDALHRVLNGEATLPGRSWPAWSRSSATASTAASPSPRARPPGSPVGSGTCSS